MAQYKVTTEYLQEQSSDLYALRNTLASVGSRLASLHLSSVLRSSGTSALQNKINDCRWAVENQSANIGKLASALSDISQIYQRTETGLTKPKTGPTSPLDVFADAIQDFWDTSFLQTAAGLLVGIGAVLGNGGENSLLHGSVTGSGEFLGIPCSGKAGYSLLGYETGSTWKAEWDMEDGEVGVSYGNKLEVFGARGEASGNVGIFGGEVKGSAGNAAVSGEVGITLFDAGKFSPAIFGKLKAETSVLEGSAKGYIGDEDNNVHINGSGTVLGAEAYAEGGIGVITETDPTTGTTSTSYGMKGKVGAEAYLAEGKVSGGITILGIDIDVGISGKAGGAGISAGGSVTTDGVSGEIGAGLGLGGGLEISIDWSDFEMPDWDIFSWW